MSLAPIHSDGVWNEHIHLLALLFVSQDKSELSHKQQASGGMWANAEFYF